MIGSISDFTRGLLRWYREHRRDLPWRIPIGSAGKLNPYHVLVSEAMLQQTQVATVIPYFHNFLQKFPTIEALANADPQQVLRAWQGLGYYSRARNLQAASKSVVNNHGGKIPSTIDELLQLPGVGRYTAGAVSSIAFEKRAPILDGNVARVLCRIDAIEGDPRDKDVRQELWARAEQVLPKKQIGDFNSALMELGAMICTPRSPQCLLCPVRKNCEASAAGMQDKIPPLKKGKIAPLVQRWTFCIRSGNRYLVEQRPARGRWAGMWQFATMEAGDTAPSMELLRSHYLLRVSNPLLIGTVEHSLTHRRYRFDVFQCESDDQSKGEWATLQELEDRPMPRPHLKICEIMKNPS